MLKDISHKTVATIATVAVLTVALAATVRAADDATGNPVQAQIDHGKSTYASKCSHCHGPNMMNSGTITPDLRAFPDDKTRFVTTVKNGKNNKMPPWADILERRRDRQSLGLRLEPEKAMRRLARRMERCRDPRGGDYRSRARPTSR